MGVINRWYRLLNLLVSNDHVSIEEIECYLQVSRQTARTTVSQVNSELNGIAVILEEDNDFLLKIYDYDEFENILNGSIKQRIDFNSASKRQAYIIKRLFLSDDYIQIQTLSEELNVSRGTVNNDLKSVRLLASDYQVAIESTQNKGLIMRGDEFNKRLLIVYRVSDFFEYD